MTHRQDVLGKAGEIISSDRNMQYGEPEQNFRRIADLWSVYLNQTVESHDVAAMMILMKLARVVTSPEVEDHWVDIAGYAACGAEVRGV